MEPTDLILFIKSIPLYIKFHLSAVEVTYENVLVFDKHEIIFSS